MNHNVWILLLWYHTGYLHTSVRSATQMWKHLSLHQKLFIFSCAALFVSVPLSALQKSFKPSAKIHQCIFNLCVPSSLQPLTEAKEQVCTESLRRRKSCVFSSSIRTTLTACQHQCSVQTPVVRNIFFTHICYQMQEHHFFPLLAHSPTFRSHIESPVGRKQINKIKKAECLCCFNIVTAYYILFDV